MKKPDLETPKLDSTPKNLRQPLWRSILVPVLVLIGAVVAWVIVVSRETPPPLSPPSPPGVTIDSGTVIRQQFYNQEIEPLLMSTERANHLATERAIQKLQETFNAYRGGIRPFTEEITSIGTRFGVLRRMPADWWNKEQSINLYIQEKFEHHLFSEGQFQSEIAGILTAFKEDLEANTNRLLGEMRHSVERQNLPEIQIPDYQKFEEHVRFIILEFSVTKSKESVYHGIATFIVAEVAVISFAQIVVRVLAVIGGNAAASAASAGGATAGGAAAGATTGTLAGPLGTAIGVGVGLVVGVVVDWWMTDNFKQKLTKELTDYINQLEEALLEGTESDAGLKVTLDQFIRDFNFAQSTVAHRAIVRGVL
jgi:uncharacterized membrane protein